IELLAAAGNCDCAKIPRQRHCTNHRRRTSTSTFMPMRGRSPLTANQANPGASLMKKSLVAFGFLLLFATSRTCAGEPVRGGWSRPRITHAFAPVGGWNPGGGMFHWWNPCCFPQYCSPNDYCRKPFPNICRYNNGHVHTGLEAGDAFPAPQGSAL